jgi:hypothetical protein
MINQSDDPRVLDAINRAQQCPTWDEIKPVFDILDARLRILEGMIGA